MGGLWCAYHPLKPARPVLLRDVVLLKKIENKKSNAVLKHVCMPFGYGVSKANKAA
jgi:hypothetical protein